MKLFDLDVEANRRAYDERGWIHVRRAVTAEFLSYAEQFIRRSLRSDRGDDTELYGHKQQYVFEFPPELDADAELYAPVAELFGFDPERLTLSERHVKVYEDDADPSPTPHKDRLASTVSLGITVRAPEGSRAFVHPIRERSTNPFQDRHLLASLPSDRHPAVALADDDAVELADRPGDVLAFAGSEMWHGRRDGAGTWLVYLKFNDFGADPLDEDLRVPARRSRSQVLAARDDLDDVEVRLGPRLESIADHAVPPSWDRVPLVHVWGRGPLQVSAVEGEVVRRAAVRGTTVGAIASGIGDRSQVLEAIRRLVAADVLVLTD